MPKGKIQHIFPEKYELKKKLEENWQSFIFKDTYLTSQRKSKFFKEINQLTKFPRSLIFNFKMWGQIRLFRKKIVNLLKIRIKSNFMKG